MELHNEESVEVISNEVIERNRSYLLLAKKNGFFQNAGKGDNINISACKDWVVALWIDELGEKKDDTQKFVNEILSNFKRWFSNGLRSVGVGKYYDILKGAEGDGLRIDFDFFDCLTNLIRSRNISVKSEMPEYKSVHNFLNIKEIIGNLLFFAKKKIPVGYQLAINYDCLLKLVKNGENISYDTFILLYTAGVGSDEWKIDLYKKSKVIEKEYRYFTCNSDEIMRLSAYIMSSAYNIGKVIELQNMINGCKNNISCYKKINTGKNQILDNLNKNVSILYFTLDQNGFKVPHNVSGELISYDGRKFVLRNLSSGDDSYEDIVIKDDDSSIVAKVISDDMVVYESRIVNERLQLKRAITKVKELGEEDILSRYVSKYGSIEGLAYLKRSAHSFISTVEKGRFPINNLFTCCFEVISEYKLNGSQEVLQYTLAAYNYIMSGEIKYLRDANYGYPVNKFLSQDVLNVVDQVCRYVVTSKMKSDMPEAPTDSAPANRGDTITEQNDEKQIFDNDTDQTQEIGYPFLGRPR